MNDGRALTGDEVEEIQRNFFRGCYHDREIDRLFGTIRIQRQVLQELFDLFKTDALQRVYNPDSIRHSALAHLKELVSLEDQKQNP